MTQTNRNGTFRWDDSKDHCLLIEVRILEPFIYKPGSKEAGQKWTELAEIINTNEGFKENPRDQRSVRERFNKLLNDFKNKMKKEEGESGTNPEELTENETLLEEILEVLKSDKTGEISSSKSSEKKERQKAVDIRDKAMTTWSKTKQDSTCTDMSDSDLDELEENNKPSRKRQRRNGSEALKYVEIKSTNEAIHKKEELAFRKQQLEIENRRLELEKERQDKLEEQIKQQGELQHQQFMMMQQQMQQQVQMQTTAQTLMVAMIEKLAKNK